MMFFNTYDAEAQAVFKQQKKPCKSAYKISVIRVPILLRGPLVQDGNTDDTDFIRGFTRIFYCLNIFTTCISLPAVKRAK